VLLSSGTPLSHYSMFPNVHQMLLCVRLVSFTDGSKDVMPRLFSAVGDDDAGSRLIEHCEAAGVRMNHVAVRLRSTKLCILTVLQRVAMLDSSSQSLACESAHLLTASGDMYVSAAVGYR
jgi:hypothetical protein